MPLTARIGAIDFWRGAVLLAILIDHIPGNGLERLTPRNFGFSDSAEAFVFISGLSVGVAYLNRARGEGLKRIVKACGNRTLLLYATHIALTFAAIAIFGLVSVLTDASELVEAHGRGLAFREPWTAASAILTLSHQLGYFNILPLYIVVMALAPAILALTLRSPALALAASLGVYAAARLWGLNLLTSPEPGGWFFNPFAWQLAFTLGVVVASWRAERRIVFNPVLLAASAGIAIAGAAVVNDGFGFWPGLRLAVEPWVDPGKQNLGLGRLVNFAAFAYLSSFAPLAPALVGSLIGAQLQRLGRHSLSVFAAGSLLSAGGQALLFLVERTDRSTLAMAFGFVYTLASAAALFALAYLLECRRETPAPPAGSDAAQPARPPWPLRPAFVR